MKNIDVDLRLLELFCCVYEKGSLSESSNCLHLSQSTISFHMHQLEKSIGLKLFYRKGRKLLPTSNAHMLYPYARKLLELKLSVIEEIKLLTGSYKGYIKIGASSIPGSYLLPEFISRYISKNPSTKIDLTVEDSEIVLRKVESGEIDLGFTGFVHYDQRMEVREVWEDSILFVGGRGVGEWLTLEELTSMPFILREETSGTRRFMESFLRSLGVDVRDLNVVLVVNKNEVILEVLRSIRAVSYLSSHVLKGLDSPEVRVLKVRGMETPVRKFYMVYSKDRPQSPA
ncbi:MAG: LysR family transcriptional regulator, partial [Aquificota bacterium]